MRYRSGRYSFSGSHVPYTVQYIVKSRNQRYQGEFPDVPMAARATIPYLTEPWYC